MSASIDDGSSTLQLGHNFELTCTVSGARNLDANFVYQWIKNSGGTRTEVGASSTLSFTPLTLSKAASYTCEVVVSSNYLTDSIVAMDTRDIRLQGTYIPY